MSLGLTLCTCSHELREHRVGGGLCLARPIEKRYGTTCGCVRYTEAPFAQQQMPLFGAIRTIDRVDDDGFALTPRPRKARAVELVAKL